jgi:hypothetical protein
MFSGLPFTKKDAFLKPREIEQLIYDAGRLQETPLPYSID